MSRTRLIETFNTHRMSVEVVQAIATAREQELCEVMTAVRRAANQPQQTAQHLIVYGERGSGKSFLMRMIEIEIDCLAKTENLPVVSALLPEEQYNIRSAPQLILAIAAKVRGAGWEDSAFAMDFRPQAQAWESAIAELNAALDQRFGKDAGLVVGMVENFDILTRNLFGGSAVMSKKTASARAIEQNSAEQLLRKLMNRKGSRLMLIAAATGTVDQDYERPLFQAFKTVDLRIWSNDDCIAYFNRRRELEHQAALSPLEEARARAIAEFIGGNPRLAQLLGEVLTTPDARSIAATLDSLSDHLADYYRHRLDDLPPQSAALLDALIRKGEPCTQTELAVRVGAGSQAQIADAFSYLLSSRLLTAGSDKLGAGKLYRLRDRLFVHFYRRRYGDPEKAMGLAPIAELLESFFTQREREQQVRRHLEDGEWADARLYAMNSPFLSMPSDGFHWYRDSLIIGVPSVLFQMAGVAASDAVAAQIELKDRPELAVKHWKDVANRAPSCLGKTAALLLEANALSRCQLGNEAEETMALALKMTEEEGDEDARILALDGMARFVFNRRKDQTTGLELFARAGKLADQAHSDYARALALCGRAWNLRGAGRYLEVIATSEQAATLAAGVGALRLQTLALRHKAYSLNQLKRHEEAAQIAEQAAELAITTGAIHCQIEAMRIQGCALFCLGRYEQAESVCGKAAQKAIEISNEREKSHLLSLQSLSLRQLKRQEQALSAAHEAAKLAAKFGDLSIQAEAMLSAGQSLNDLQKYDEAVAVLEETEQLASDSGDIALKLEAMNLRVWSLSMLNQHEQAIELALTTAETATMAGNAGELTDALRLMGWSLAKLNRLDEAQSAFEGVFTIAKAAGQTWQLVANLEDQSKALGEQKPEQSLAFARETIAEISNTATSSDLWLIRCIFFVAASRTRTHDLTAAVEAALKDAEKIENFTHFTDILDEIFAAIAYNNTWDEITVCLLRCPLVLSNLNSPWAFDKVGGVWNEKVKAVGRAQTYAEIAKQLPAIVQLTELLAGAELKTGVNRYVRGIINGLLNHCGDAGFLQDMADLLLEGFGDSADEIQRLRAFAHVLSATDKEEILQRLDPDLALAIRRILGLPDPDDILAKKGRRKGR